MCFENISLDPSFNSFLYSWKVVVFAFYGELGQAVPLLLNGFFILWELLSSMLAEFVGLNPSAFLPLSLSLLRVPFLRWDKILIIYL